MTRHAIIALREEARRLLAAMTQCVLDQSLDPDERHRLVMQMVVDVEDVKEALVELGGPEALHTILTS